MNFFKKLSAILIAVFLLATSLTAVACKDNKKEDDKPAAANLPEGAYVLDIPGLDKIDYLAAGWHGKGISKKDGYDFSTTGNPFDFTITNDKTVLGTDKYVGNACKGTMKKMIDQDHNYRWLAGVSLTESEQAVKEETAQKVKKITFDYTCDVDLTVDSPIFDSIKESRNNFAYAYYNDFIIEFKLQDVYGGSIISESRIWAHIEFEKTTSGKVKTCVINLTKKQTEDWEDFMAAHPNARLTWFQLGFFSDPVYEILSNLPDTFEAHLTFGNFTVYNEVED